MSSLGVYTTILMNLIIREYFNDHFCLLTFTDSGFDYAGPLPSVRIQIMNGSVDSNLIFHHYGCQGIVIYSNDPLPVFVEFEKQIKSNVDRFNQRRFLVVAKNPTKNLETTFFELRELDFVTDFLLVSPQDNDLRDDDITFELKTHKYVGVSDNNEPLLVDKWFSKNQTFLFGAELYPDKLTDQMGRPFVMACIWYEPYSIIGNSANEHYGSELASAVHFGLKYNMSPVTIVKQEDYWGEIFPNWTGYGILGHLAEDKADVGFSSMDLWASSFEYLDFSVPTVRTGVTCLVPAPKLASRWSTPLLSYSTNLWICIIAVLSISIFALFLILCCYNRFIFVNPDKTSSDFINVATAVVLKPTLAQSLEESETPRKISGKVMIGLTLVLGLFLTSTYSSGLASVMTLPRYEKAIDTIADLARSDLDWGATDEAWITVIGNAQEPDYVKILSNFVAVPVERLQELSKTGQFGFAIERLPFDNYAIGRYVARDVITRFHLMKEDVYYAHCVMMLRKNSVHTPSLNLFLLRMAQAGLISKWQSQAVELFMDNQVQRVVKFYKNHQVEAEVVNLQLSHVEGAFALLIFGYLLSVVVFISELMMKRK